MFNLVTIVVKSKRDVCHRLHLKQKTWFLNHDIELWLNCGFSFQVRPHRPHQGDNEQRRHQNPVVQSGQSGEGSIIHQNYCGRGKKRLRTNETWTALTTCGGCGNQMCLDIVNNDMPWTLWTTENDWSDQQTNVPFIFGLCTSDGELNWDSSVSIIGSLMEWELTSGVVSG